MLTIWIYQREAVIREKLKALQFKNEQKHMLRLLRSILRTNLPIKLSRRKKKFMLKLQKLWPRCMWSAWLTWKDIKFGGRHEQKTCSSWWQHISPESIEPIQRFEQEIPWYQPFTACKDGYTDLEIDLNWKKKKLLDRAAATFWVELKRLLMEKEYHSSLKCKGSTRA